MSETASEDTGVTMSRELNDLGELITAARPDCVLNWAVANNELSVEVGPASLRAFTAYLQGDSACQFNLLVDLTAVDYPERDKRFDVVYHYLSMYQNARIRVKCAIREDESVPSITALHPGAGWYEREVFDMFGILFKGHDDLRRLLTDYGFQGHPLRKDFPTTGYVEVRYDEGEKRVVYEPVKLVQEYRQFDFTSPWEGMNQTLPGDGHGAGTGADDGAATPGQKA